MFDSHAHLTDVKFGNDRRETVERARAAGVDGIITIHSPVEDAKPFLELMEEYDCIYGAAGIHPGDKAADRLNAGFDTGILEHKKVVAVGEIGLDYYWKDNPPFEIQKELFEMQLDLAAGRGLPVIIHCRDAWKDMLGILENRGAIKGVMHCFSGDVELMEKCLDAGLYISIAGPVTYPKAEKARQVAAAVPAERLLVETDCPYLAPQEFRGKRNEPAYVCSTLRKIAELRNISPEEAGRITTENTRKLFGI